MAKLLNISKISNNSTDIILFRSCFRIFYVVRELGYPHRQLRGFRREEHTAAHVLCLFEPVGRVAQNMSKKACETNRKRSMSVGIAGEAVSCTSKNTKNQLQSTNKICYYLSYEHKCISDANTGGQIRQWKRKPHILF